MMSALKGVQGGLRMLMLLVILSVNTKILLTDWRGQNVQKLLTSYVHSP